MPVFEIALDDGRKLRIDADDQQAALAGVDQFTSQPANAPKSTSVIDALGSGVGGVLSGVGETAEQFIGKGNVSEKLKKAGAAVTPDNYDANASKLYSDKAGLTLGNAGNAIAEGAPGFGVDLAAGMAARRLHPVAAPLAIAASYLMRTRGEASKKDADERTGVEGTTPEFQDKARALLRGIPEAALNTLAPARLLPGAGKIANVGMKGVAEAGGRALTTAGIEGATNAAQGVVAEVGSTIGTKGGARLPASEDMINDALTGKVVGGAFAAPSAIKQSSNAVRLRKFGGDNQAASTDAANRVQQAAGDGDLSNTKVAAKAFNDAAADVHSELGDAVKAARAGGSLGEDVALDNAVARAARGGRFNDTDNAAIDNAPASVKALAKTASMLAELKQQNLGDSTNFKAGLSTRAEKAVRALANPIGVGTGAALGALSLTGQAATLGTSHLGALGAIGVGYGASRLVDKFTGARSPVKRFTDQFANGAGPQRIAPNAPTPEETDVPRGPWNPAPSPQVGTYGKGPRTPDAPLEPEGRYNPRANIAIDEGIRKITDKIGGDHRRTQTAQALAALKKLAATNQPPPAPEAPAPAPPMFSEDASALAKWKMKIKANSDAAAYKAQGEAEAARLANGSPMLEEVGGRRAVENPAMGKTARQYVSAANAIKKLTSQPAEAAEEGAPVEKVVKVKKTKGEVKEKTVKVKAPKPAPVVEAPTAPAAPLAPAPFAPPPLSGIGQRALAEVMARSQGRTPGDGGPKAPPVAEAPPVVEEAPVVKVAKAKAKSAKTPKAEKPKAKNETDADAPHSAYAHLDIDDAASAIVAKLQEDGKLRASPERAHAGVVRNIRAIREAANAVTDNADVVKDIAASMEGANRDDRGPYPVLKRLKAKYPDAAKAIDKHFNKKMVYSVWKQ